MCAKWYEYLDGSAIPSGNWQSWAEEGDTVIVDFWDPAINAINQAIRVNSWGGLNEWFLGPMFNSEAVVAARFKVAALSDTGAEDILCVTTDSDTSSGNLSITIVDKRYKLYDYTAGIEILDIGPVVVDELHTAYLHSRNDGKARAWWDGNLIFDGIVMGAGYSGWVEFGSGSWQKSAHTTVDFDWVGYGGPADLIPEPSSLLALGSGLLGILGFIRRKR